MKKSMMNKWVKALRSGKYTQGHSYLRKYDEETDSPKHCCLGVLCEIRGVYIPFDQQLIDVGDLENCGIKTDYGKLYKKYKAKNGTYKSLADLNDQGLSFKQIARIIEWNYKDL